ncbi:homocysteine S-methyltransferase family protein [Jiella sonneratiae]|uniref:Homocysteine S-methyltransferase family protein n=1 Tax=Jiella sonneratiae TaxID=2816856 RepID=A0ABS3J8H1_9HYPH|nr:homocysteine S-methyltransferase family protein [Jiella sonneratiae]MBO0905970.1 homocysteine S-methyltransferase family protein [Jiella sonneratiae]
MPTLAERLAAPGTVILADGAMGTNLFALGLAPGTAPETWLDERPDAIAALHRSFVAAGSEVILTCSFGGNPPRLALWGAEGRAFALNRRAAELARAAADASLRPVLVAGSVGPTWQTGEAAEDAMAAIFFEQIAGLKQGGIDFVWLETMVSAAETRAAAMAAIAAGLSYVATASFDHRGLTPAGLAPAGFAAAFDGLARPPLAIGANCGDGPASALAIAGALPRPAGAALALKPNCGLPAPGPDGARHAIGPADLAAFAAAARAAGATLVGGCCGTTPGHVRAMREALDRRVACN